MKKELEIRLEKKTMLRKGTSRRKQIQILINHDQIYHIISLYKNVE